MRLGFFETVKKSGHSEPVRTQLRAKSRLRRLRYARACGRSGLGDPPVIRNIFNSENADFPKIQGIATPACGLVRDDRSFLTR